MNQLQGDGYTFLKRTKSLLMSGALLLALGLVFATTKAQATNITWIVDSGTFATPANWSTGATPVDSDTAVFTNEDAITVNLGADTALMSGTIISNHTGVITINGNNHIWNATNSFRIGIADSTSTVYLASGTLAASNPNTANSQLRIADSISTNPAIVSCVATLFVTNGTVAADAGSVGAASNSVGTLIISGNGFYTEGLTASGSSLTIGTSSSGNSLIVTNGGRLFVDGTLTVGNNVVLTNNSMLLSGPTSAGTISTLIKFTGNSSQLILSNGAVLSTGGSMLFGSNSSGSTGVVDGAGTRLIIGGSFQVGANGGGGTNNLFTVQNGASISVQGTFAYGNNGFHIHDGFVMGGTGLMSTGIFTVVRSASNNTNHDSNFMTVTNALLACNYLNPQGPIETVSILGKGTLQLTNSISISVPAGNSNSVSFGSSGGTLTINGGTLDNRLTPDNVGGIAVAGTGGIGGNSLIITNGGKLLTGNGTLGAGTSFNTGLVSGVSSVWSNFSNIANYTNVLIVGTAAGSSNGNYLAVSDGASVIDSGNFLIGNQAQSASNSVAFGGSGAAATVNIGAALRIGSSTGISNNDNQVTVSNATVTCASISVGQPFQVVPILTFTTNVGSVVVTNFCASTNGLIVSSVLTNCAPTINTNSVFNLLTVSGGTVTAGLIQVVGSNTLVYSGGALLYTNLQVDGIMSGAATLNVPNGSTLGGIGSVANPVTVASGGVIAPGDGAASVGTLTISNTLVLGATPTLNYDLGSTANADKLVVVGNLTLGGILNINTNNIPGTFGVGNYTLITYTGSLVNNGLTPPTPFPGLAYAIAAGSGSVVLQVTAAGGGGPSYSTWVTHYGLTGGNALGTADPLGKGMDNTNQFLAGFNPTNAAAYLRITAVSKTNANTDIRVDYLGASGDSTYSGGPASRTNVLEFTTGSGGSYNSNSFASTGQTNVLSGGTGFGTQATMVDPGGATNVPARYYRVRVLVP